MARLTVRSLVVLLAAAALARAGGVVLETPRIRAVVGADAVWRSLTEKKSGRELCAAAARMPFAAARVDGTTRGANRAAFADGRLTVGFAGCNTQLTYAVTPAPDWLAFRLERVEGTRPTHLTLVRLGTTLTEHVGRRLNIGWTDRHAVCLMALNLQTQGKATRRKGYAELAAVTQDAPGPRLEGAAAALVVAPTPEIRGILRRLSVAFDLPRNEHDGVPSKDLPLARQSYWFLRFGEKDADRVIDLCKQTGFRQVMMNSGSWCRTVGHYTFRTDAYPDGIESLRRTVAKLHDHGILVGMHCFASKISKTDAYVTPVPDRRFWVDLSVPLAADVGPTQTSLRATADLREWPGSPVAKRTSWEGGVAKHREVIVDNELIRYDAIGPEGKWNTFLGCTRGSWGTRASPHKAGAACRHYGVDGCINGYIIDQETDLLAQAHDRLARIFNTSGFDMVYFDGGEDVDRRRFTHYVSKFQASALGRFRKRPIVHMGTILTHNLWHAFTRSSTVDTYPNTIRGRLIAGGTWDKLPSVKDHIDRSVRYMLSVRDDLMPGELGWFGIWPKSRDFEGLQLDEIEYLMCKSLAHGVPISLQTSFAAMDAHPLTPGILEIAKVYEKLRLSGKVDRQTRERLRTPGKDFVLVYAFEAQVTEIDERGEERGPFPELTYWVVEVAPLHGVAGDPELRAFFGKDGRNTCVSLWHRAGKQGKLVLDRKSVSLWNLDGSATMSGTTGDRIGVPIGPRRTVFRFRDENLEAVAKLLREARFEVRPPTTLWLQAEDAARMVGKMAKGSAAGVKEADAFGDVVVCTGRPSTREPQEWYAEYRVAIPHAGRWTLWARVRYPSGADLSFAVVRAGETVTLQGAQVLGNCGRNDKKWHWTGRGGGSTSVPPGAPITWRLPKGDLIFRIYAREGGGTAATNPRLDALCLTDDPEYRPTDEGWRP